MTWKSASRAFIVSLSTKDSNSRGNLARLILLQETIDLLEPNEKASGNVVCVCLYCIAMSKRGAATGR
jgi:hypothetical protein